jgi:hypothetical protein
MDPLLDSLLACMDGLVLSCVIQYIFVWIDLFIFCMDLLLFDSLLACMDPPSIWMDPVQGHEWSSPA